jgi:hypothetical protein
MHVAMAMIAPLRLSGKTPKVRITRPANRAILRKIKVVTAFGLGHCLYCFAVALAQNKER